MKNIITTLLLLLSITGCSSSEKKLGPEIVTAKKTESKVVTIETTESDIPTLKSENVTKRLHLVKEGAFLMSSEPEINGRRRHKRIAYLPVGSLVSFPVNFIKKKIFNYRDDKYEDYILVDSNTGVSGFIRSDLTTEVRDEVVIVALTEKQTPIFNETTKTKAYLTRSEGTYLPLIEAPNNSGGYIEENDIFKTVTKYISNSGYIWAKNEENHTFKINFKYIEDGRLLWIEKNNNLKFFKKIADNTSHDEITSRLLKKVSKKKEVTDGFKNAIKELVHSSCDTEISSTSNATIGVNSKNIPVVNITAATGINLNWKIKEPGYKTEVKEVKYLDTKKREKALLMFKKYKCKNGSINQLTHIAFSADKYTFELDYDQMQNSIKELHWDSNLKDEAARKKMFVIKGHNTYYNILNYLEERAELNNGYLVRITADHRFFIINLLINEISDIFDPNLH